MADILITTYGELRDEVAAWLARSNQQAFIDRVPLFIQMAEAEINRRLEVAEQEAEATLVFAPGDASRPLPADYGGMRGLPYMPNNSLAPLDYLTPSEIRSRYRDPALRDIPRVYTLQERSLFVKPVPDTDLDINILYHRGVPALRTTGTGSGTQANNGTNWLLDSHPDVYLKGSLYFAHDYTGNDQKAANWERKFNEAMEKLEDDDWSDRWAGAPLVSTPNKIEGAALYPRYRYQGRH